MPEITSNTTSAAIKFIGVNKKSQPFGWRVCFKLRYLLDVPGYGFKSLFNSCGVKILSFVILCSTL